MHSLYSPWLDAVREFGESDVLGLKVALGPGKLSGAKTSRCLHFVGTRRHIFVFEGTDHWTLVAQPHAHAARALQGPSWQAQGSTMQILSCRGGPAWVSDVYEH